MNRLLFYFEEWSGIEFMKLTEIEIGGVCRVVGIPGSGPSVQRLMEMGIIPGVAIRLVKTAPLGDPIEIEVRGYHLAIRKSEAELIEVSA